MGAATIGMGSKPFIDDSVPHVGNLPELPFRLQTPQKCAGTLTLPAKSVPISILLPPHANSAPPPPVDAPAEKAEL